MKEELAALPHLYSHPTTGPGKEKEVIVAPMAKMNNGLHIMQKEKKKTVAPCFGHEETVKKRRSGWGQVGKGQARVAELALRSAIARIQCWNPPSGRRRNGKPRVLTSSIVTPKKNFGRPLKTYWPCGSAYKILVKVLASKLRMVIGTVTGEHQFAFVRAIFSFSDGIEDSNFAESLAVNVGISLFLSTHCSIQQSLVVEGDSKNMPYAGLLTMELHLDV
ncbi:Uncharacterized protein TCM_024934 [Theobroma cacao]|uniref:Uncharacterized protein n=1 Tax=Theobroma cacao TaxID=3641 RepID=A0A061EYL2_THECC|nr:Uncharacterized protein TCM_024934 [Theobroma cacao]